MSVAGFKLTIWIPVEQVGIVIGRSGATISRIQSSSSSRLNVVPDPEASPWAPVYIKGAPDGVFMAAKLVSDLVEELDDAVAEFHLSAKGRDKLRAGGPDDGLGNLSPEARRISAELGVRMRVPPAAGKGRGDEHRPSKDGEAEPVTLEGALDRVKRALQCVIAAAGGKKLPPAPGAPAPPPPPPERPCEPPAPPPPAVERLVQVPARKLRLVARRGQQQPVYRMIARYSGAQIVKCPRQAPAPAAGT